MEGWLNSITESAAWGDQVVGVEQGAGKCVSLLRINIFTNLPEIEETTPRLLTATLKPPDLLSNSVLHFTLQETFFTYSTDP